jgi:hypothetical protein
MVVEAGRQGGFRVWGIREHVSLTNSLGSAAEDAVVLACDRHCIKCFASAESTPQSVIHGISRPCSNMKGSVPLADNMDS